MPKQKQPKKQQKRQSNILYILIDDIIANGQETPYAKTVPVGSTVYFVQREINSETFCKAVDVDQKYFKPVSYSPDIEPLPRQPDNTVVQAVYLRTKPGKTANNSIKIGSQYGSAQEFSEYQLLLS